MQQIVLAFVRNHVARLSFGVNRIFDPVALSIETLECKLEIKNMECKFIISSPRWMFRTFKFVFLQQQLGTVLFRFYVIPMQAVQCVPQGLRFFEFHFIKSG